jgi:uncharacterized membrane protein (DUF485 family)
MSAKKNRKMRVSRSDPIVPIQKRTADSSVTIVNWERIAAMDEFKVLVAAKLKFIVPATVFFLVYYFALPVLVGYAPRLMETKVLGVVNLAYVFALSQFFMAWILAAMYLRAAGRFDEMAKDVVDKIKRR